MCHTCLVRLALHCVWFFELVRSCPLVLGVSPLVQPNVTISSPSERWVFMWLEPLLWSPSSVGMFWAFLILQSRSAAAEHILLRIPFLHRPPL